MFAQSVASILLDHGHAHGVKQFTINLNARGDSIVSKPWFKAAEEFLWAAEILQTMGRYAQALILACHSIDLCTKAKIGDFSYQPFKRAPEECINYIFPQEDKTPEDLVTEEVAAKFIAHAKRCLGL